MRHPLRLRAVAGIVLVACAAGSAVAGTDPTGSWRRDDGLGGIRIVACGRALCGYIAWLRDADSPARVGELVLYDMRQVGAEVWSGTAHNPEDGREYAGTLTLDGDRLTTRGCLAGLICRSVVLSRKQ